MWIFGPSVGRYDHNNAVERRHVRVGPLSLNFDLLAVHCPSIHPVQCVGSIAADADVALAMHVARMRRIARTTEDEEEEAAMMKSAV